MTQLVCDTCGERFEQKALYEGHLAIAHPPGRAPTRGGVSAAAVAKILGGIHFPRSRAELSAHAQKNRAKMEDPDAVLRVLEMLPEGRYTDMADVEFELGKIL